MLSRFEVHPNTHIKTAEFHQWFGISLYQVFEDESKGIVCYEDANGEVICEGYDEGPRFSQQNSRNLYYQR